jgi:hypothetical protein
MGSTGSRLAIRSHTGVVTVDYANVELYTRRLTWVDTLSSAVRCMTSRPIFVPSADSGRGLSSYLEEA